jgi:NAD(P)-dependent dehydrogenase (short-subunit alcohol dehydrogenase family)
VAKLLSMEGRVAIVTGAGRGLGRAYAHLLATRGASVLVNDRGTDVDGHGSDSAIAESVVAEIAAQGGRAVANHSDVSTPEGGQSIVDQALSAFGRVDAIVNNAGIVGVIPFGQTTLADFERYWRVHFAGHYNVTKAAWPLLTAQRSGRVVMTGSGGGLYGLSGHSTYAAAKMAIQGLARVLAIEGAESNVLVNVVTPGGFSRMHEASKLSPERLEWAKKFQPPELVAPLVLWLASEECHVTGRTFVAWAGRIARVAVGAGRGLIDRELTGEAIVAGYEKVDSLDEFYEPVDVLDEVNRWLSEIGKAGGLT